MNIGALSTFIPASNNALKPAELNSVGTQSFDDNFSSERPVPSVEAIEPTRAPGTATERASDSEQQAQSGSGGLSDLDESRAERQNEAQLLQEQQEIQSLSARDREVRAHEQAHAAVGGQYAGAPRYEFQRGPDGVRYAVGGEVSIDVSPASTPEETVRKMEIVQRAALAPAEPSPQDRKVAAQASATAAQARQEVAIESREPSELGSDDASEEQANTADDAQFAVTSPAPSSANPGQDADPPSLLVDSSVSNNRSILSSSSPSPSAGGINRELQQAILAAQEASPIGRNINQLA